MAERIASPAVIDASAVLIVLLDEPGAGLVRAALPSALISAVNLAEVVGKLNEHGVPEDAAREAIGGLRLEVVSFDEDAAWETGMLRAASARAGLSLGDRACLALAAKAAAPAYTADRMWSELSLGVEIRVVR